MVRNRKSIVLLVLMVVLLVLISSRMSPRQSGRTKTPAVTDDPVPSPTEPVETEAPPADTPEPTPSIYDELPGISRSDWNLKLVNNTYVLANTFAPNVVSIRDNNYFDERAADRLEAMLRAAERAGYTVCVRNAYRPFSTQAYLFNGKASQILWGTDMTLMEAEEKARKIVAYPGTSEHQLGLAADIIDYDFPYLNREQEERPTQKWLMEHCWDYGFILRYPPDRSEITGIIYEPWHYRYVGVEAAQEIRDLGLTLEEYLEQYYEPID